MSLSASAPWRRFYGNMPCTIDYPRLTMYQLVAQTAKRVPNLCAYEFMNRKTSFSAFLRRIDRAAAALYDSVDKQLGVVPAVKSAVRVENGRTVYELAFPRLLVSPFRLQAGSAMRFSVLVNVNNGKGRAGWLELTPGIGQTPKLPGNFIDLILLPETKDR